MDILQSEGARFFSNVPDNKLPVAERGKNVFTRNEVERALQDADTLFHDAARDALRTHGLEAVLQTWETNPAATDYTTALTAQQRTQLQALNTDDKKLLGDYFLYASAKRRAAATPDGFVYDYAFQRSDGTTVTAQERIPVEGMLDVLRKAIRVIEQDHSLPEDQRTRQIEELLTQGRTLYRNSEPLPQRWWLTALLPGTDARERVRDEERRIAQDPLRNGRGNFVRGINTLRFRRGLAMPAAAAPAPPAPTPPAAPPPPGPAAAPELAPAPVAARAVAPAAASVANLRREFVIVNRSADLYARAASMSEQSLQEQFREGGPGVDLRRWKELQMWKEGLRPRPRQWLHKMGLRLLEEKHRIVRREQVAKAMIANNNTYLEMNVVGNAVTDATAHIAEQKAAGKAKIEQVKKGVKYGDEEIVDVATGPLRDAIVNDIIRPILEDRASPLYGGHGGRQITNADQLQDVLRAFVETHQRDAVVQQIFGRNETQYGSLAKYFATDIWEVAQGMKEDLQAHRFSLDQLDHLVTVKLANTTWAAETRAQYNATDKFIAWAQTHGKGWITLNPLTASVIGYTVAAGTAAFVRAPRFVATWVLPYVAPVAGVGFGVGFAAARRYHDLKVDTAEYRRRREYGEQVPANAPRLKRLEEFDYDRASMQQLIGGGGQEGVTGANRLSVDALIVQDLSAAQAANRQAAARRIAEIKARRNISDKTEEGLIEFENQWSIDAVDRPRLDAAIAQLEEALRVRGGMAEAEIRTLGNQCYEEWKGYLEQNMKQQDAKRRAFTRVEMVKTGAFAAVGGAISIPVGQEIVAGAGRIVEFAAEHAGNYLSQWTQGPIDTVGEGVAYGVRRAADTVAAWAHRVSGETLLEKGYKGAAGFVHDQVVGPDAPLPPSSAFHGAPAFSDLTDGGSRVLDGDITMRVNPDDHTVAFFDKHGNLLAPPDAATIDASGTLHGADALPAEVQAHLRQEGLQAAQHAQEVVETFGPGSPSAADLQELHRVGGYQTINEHLVIRVDPGGEVTFLEPLGNDAMGVLTDAQTTLDADGNFHVTGELPQTLKEQLEEAGFGVNRGADVVTEVLKAGAPTHADSTLGIQTNIPDGTKWVPGGSGKFDLVVDGHESKILINDAQVVNGKLEADWANSLLQATDIHPQTETIPGDFAEREQFWDKAGEKLHHREYYSWDQAGSQRTELQLYNQKDGDAVIMDGSHMEQYAYQKGLVPNPVDITEVKNKGEMAFAISLPGEEGSRAIIVPDIADGVIDGKVRFDPSDTVHTFQLADGTTITNGEFSQRFLNPAAYAHLKDGSLASEYRGLLESFRIGNPDGPKSGTISVGRLVTHPDGTKVWQSFATIRGRGGPGDITSTFFEINSIPVEERVPTYDIVRRESPLPPPAPFAPRWPVEKLRKKEGMLYEEGALYDEHVPYDEEYSELMYGEYSDFVEPKKIEEEIRVLSDQAERALREKTGTPDALIVERIAAQKDYIDILREKYRLDNNNPDVVRMLYRLNGATKNYINELEDQNKSLPPMSEKARLTVAIPAYNEAGKIEKTIRGWLHQLEANNKEPIDPETVEFIILSNRPNTTKSFDTMASVIDNLKKNEEFKDYAIHVVEKTFNFPDEDIIVTEPNGSKITVEKNKRMGLIYKYVADLALLRNLARSDNLRIANHLLRTGGADVYARNPRFLSRVFSLFSDKPELEQYVSRADYPPIIYQKMPLLHFANRLNEMMNLQYTKGKSHIGLGTYRAALYAGSGGFNAAHAVREEIALSRRMRELIKQKEAKGIQARRRETILNALDDPRRVMTTILSGKPITQAYDTWVNDAIRTMDIKDVMGKPLPAEAMLTLENVQKQTEAMLQFYFRQILDSPPGNLSHEQKTERAFDLTQRYMKRALLMLGIDHFDIAFDKDIAMGTTKDSRAIAGNCHIVIKDIDMLTDLVKKYNERPQPDWVNEASGIASKIALKKNLSVPAASEIPVVTSAEHLISEVNTHLAGAGTPAAQIAVPAPVFGEYLKTAFPLPPGVTLSNLTVATQGDRIVTNGSIPAGMGQETTFHMEFTIAADGSLQMVDRDSTINPALLHIPYTGALRQGLQQTNERITTGLDGQINQQWKTKGFQILEENIGINFEKKRVSSERYEIDQNLFVTFDGVVLPLTETDVSQTAASEQLLVMTIVSDEFPELKLDNNQDAVRVEKQGTTWKIAIADGVGSGGTFSKDMAVVAVESAFRLAPTGSEIPPGEEAAFLQRIADRLKEYAETISDERKTEALSSMSPLAASSQIDSLKTGRSQTKFAYGTVEEIGTEDISGASRKKGKLRYLTIGEGEFFIVRADGSVEELPFTKGPSLTSTGEIRGSPVVGEAELTEGDIVCLATDGITYKDYPRQRQEIIDKLQVMQRAGNVDLRTLSAQRTGDDVTLAVIQFK